MSLLEVLLLRPLKPNKSLQDCTDTNLEVLIDHPNHTRTLQSERETEAHQGRLLPLLLPADMNPPKWYWI